MWGPPCTHQPLYSAPSGEHSQLPMCLSAGDTGLSVDRESPGPQGGEAQGDRTTCLLNRPHPQAAASWGALQKQPAWRFSTSCYPVRDLNASVRGLSGRVALSLPGGLKPLSRGQIYSLMPAGFYVWCFLLQVPGGCLYPGTRGRGSLATRAAVRSGPRCRPVAAFGAGSKGDAGAKEPFPVSRELGAPGRFSLHPTSHPLPQPSHPSWVQTRGALNY